MKKLVIKYLGPLKANQYYPTAQEKTSIVLHHTAGGSAAEAVRWWNQTADRVGTALLVERDGQAYQCFEINRWAYSLGIKGVKPDFEKSNVGIELVSYGFVMKEGDKFYAYPNYPNMQRKVEIAKDQVIELKSPFKGFTYWHKYTDQCIETTVQVCRYLVDRFGIKVQDNLDTYNDYDLSVARENKPGIWSHNTVRKDKYDLYPDPNLLKALKAEFGQTKKEEVTHTHTHTHKPNTK